jgi:hypothetical protein
MRDYTAAQGQLVKRLRRVEGQLPRRAGMVQRMVLPTWVRPRRPASITTPKSVAATSTTDRRSALPTRTAALS